MREFSEVPTVGECQILGYEGLRQVGESRRHIRKGNSVWLEPLGCGVIGAVSLHVTCDIDVCAERVESELV